MSKTCRKSEEKTEITKFSQPKINQRQFLVIFISFKINSTASLRHSPNWKILIHFMLFIVLVSVQLVAKFWSSVSTFIFIVVVVLCEENQSTVISPIFSVAIT